MQHDGVIRRRLKSLRQRNDEKDERKRRAKADLEARAAANGIDVVLQALVDQPNQHQLADRTMPLAFYYGVGSLEERDTAWAARRAAFYADCARVFSFAGWSLDAYAPELALADQVAGRDGRGLDLRPIDRDQAVIINTSSAPLEHLVSQNWLETPKDPPGYGMLRWATALRFRDEVAGSQSGGLKGQNLEGGSGGFRPRLVSDFALDCMATVSAVRQRLHPGLFRLLELVVVDDTWVWEIDARKLDRRVHRKGVPSKRRDLRQFERYRKRLLQLRRDKIILKLHKAIDGAAVVFEYMSEREYRDRWTAR